jgi:hypothetical protein
MSGLFLHKIRNLFANFVRFGNKNQPVFSSGSTLEEMDSAEFHLAASDLSEDIITHF